MRRLLRRFSSTQNNASEHSDEYPQPDFFTANPPPQASSSMSAYSIKRPPYETPDAKGRCWFVELPEQVLAAVFVKLDRVSLTRCYRLCKSVNEFMAFNSHVALHHLLTSNSLIFNPPTLLANPRSTTIIPPTYSTLLSSLRERLTRFRNFTPKTTTTLAFEEPEGNLYEYLEGVLMRGVVRPGRELCREIAFYDMRKVGEWEDVGGDQVGAVVNEEEEEEGGEGEGEEEEDNTEEAGVRKTKKFDFDVAEFAVDPGMDLLVLTEVRSRAHRNHRMYFHLLSLSTFEPHPRAAQPIIEWPLTLARRKISLGFQICDDGLFVLNHKLPGGAQDQVCGWQWTTGRLAVTLKAFPTMSFESFVLLSPSSFVIPTIITHLDTLSDTQDELDNPSDLSFTHHLHIYAFPPFSAVKINPNPSEPLPPPHTAIHIATLDLPRFLVDFSAHIPPPHLSIRTDPPPRHTLPTHPKYGVSPWMPTPESGVIIIEVNCHDPVEPDPHFVIVCLKSTLIQYLPAPTSPLLFQAFPRPAPVVPWQTLAPNVRMFGPDAETASWVCYVYQDRYVTTRHDMSDHRNHLRLYDFNPLRLRKEISERTDALPASAQPFTSPVTASSSSSPPPPKRRSLLPRFLSDLTDKPSNPIEGSRDGVMLVIEETVIAIGNRSPLINEVRTGSRFPYMFVERLSHMTDVALIDAERIIAVQNENDPWADDAKCEIRVMEF